MALYRHWLEWRVEQGEEEKNQWYEARYQR